MQTVDAFSLCVFLYVHMGARLIPVHQWTSVREMPVMYTASSLIVTRWSSVLLLCRLGETAFGDEGAALLATALPALKDLQELRFVRRERGGGIWHVSFSVGITAI